MYVIKNQKSKIKNCIAFLAILFVIGCSDWLDGALPKDRNLADKQFATERGIHAALNGLYSALTSTNLYGGRLTMTDIELLAHYYYYFDNLEAPGMSGFRHFLDMSSYNWEEDGTISAFTGIWNAAYKTIFEINTFISYLSETDVISTEKKYLFLGEAYGLRAFLHFDLFRLFAYESDGVEVQSIPYNNTSDVIPHFRLSHDEFYRLLLDDIELASTLLANDPIRSQSSILDLRDAEDIDVSSEEIFERFLRNYRMNYYAVKTLHARILMYKGEVQEAANLAQEIIQESFRTTDDATGSPFRWANRHNVMVANDRNHIFYEEVIFGINNPDIYTRWRTYTQGTTVGGTYSVDFTSLRGNIFKNDQSQNDISLWEDIRAAQWVQSAITNLVGPTQYVSSKYERFTYTDNNPKQYFQPLIRTAELFYIVAEAMLVSGNIRGSVQYLNAFRAMRGSQVESLPNPDEVTDPDFVFDILETEYYKEFYAEGQAYFYLKRRKATEVFDATGPGKVPLPDGAFLVLIPQNEKEFN